MRLAWFSPWPPDPSGVAGRSAEIVAVLAGRGHGIDVFVDDARLAVERRQPDAAPALGRVRVMSPHDFVWRMTAGQYDLAVYQVGNSHLHDHIWPYLFHFPGLSVLHDGRVHHARALALTSRGRTDEYRDEFAWNHPGVPVEGAEFALRGSDGVYLYQWPMIRGVLAASRLTATHTRGARAELERSSDGRPVEYIALGEGLATPMTEPARQARRASAGISDRAVVFGVFGGLTAEKRVLQILRSFAATYARHPETRLVLSGAPEKGLDIPAIGAELGIAPATTVLGRLDDPSFDEWIAAVDVTLNLRWPSALETSGPWLRALSAARPTVIVDLEHLSDVPALDPRTWQLHTPARGSAETAVAVSIDILDEEHSLGLAMRRLASDRALRDRLGHAARRYWEGEHTLDRMADDYERVMASARQMPPPAVDLPAHLRPDPWAHTRELVSAFDSGVRDAIARLHPASPRP
jgi:glycosyltransferase involved in cell wall biosynthesis